MSIAQTPPTPVLVAHEPRGPGAGGLEWGPGIRFVSVAAIVLGFFWLIGGVWQILIAFTRVQDPMLPVYAQVPLLGTWRWASALCAVAAGVLALLGGVDGLRHRPSARPLLRLATLVVVINWLIDLALWGGWCFDAFGTAASTRFYYGSAPNPYAGFQPYPVVYLRAHVIASLVVSSIVTLAWMILVLTLVRPRRAARLAEEGGTTSRVLPIDPTFEPRGDVAAPLSYQSPGTRAAVVPLQAGPALLKALFWIGIVLGAVNLVSDGTTALQYAPQLAASRPLGSPRVTSAAGITPQVFAGLHLIAAAAALAVIIGCVLGLARRIRAGRVVLFIGLTVVLLVALAQLQQQLAGTINALSVSRWTVFVSIFATFCRGQVYTVICFVALARAPIAPLREG